MSKLRNYQTKAATSLASNSGDNIMNNEGFYGLIVLAEILLGGKKAAHKWQDEQNDFNLGYNKLFKSKAKEIAEGRWISAFAKEVEALPRLDSSSAIIGVAFKMKKLGVKLPKRFIEALPKAAEVNMSVSSEYNSPSGRMRAVNNVLSMYKVKTKVDNSKPKYF